MMKILSMKGTSKLNKYNKGILIPLYLKTLLLNLRKMKKLVFLKILIKAQFRTLRFYRKKWRNQ